MEGLTDVIIEEMICMHRDCFRNEGRGGKPGQSIWHSYVVAYDGTFN